MTCDKSFLRILKVRYRVYQERGDAVGCARVEEVVRNQFAPSTLKRFQTEMAKYAKKEVSR